MFFPHICWYYTKQGIQTWRIYIYIYICICICIYIYIIIIYILYIYHVYTIPVNINHTFCFKQDSQKPWSVANQTSHLMSLNPHHLSLAGHVARYSSPLSHWGDRIWPPGVETIPMKHFNVPLSPLKPGHLKYLKSLPTLCIQSKAKDLDQSWWI